MTRGALALSIAAAASLAVGSCTTFDGKTATLDEGAGEGPKKAPEGSQQPGFLQLDDAVKACSKAVLCPQMSDSTLNSLTLPLDAASFSACVDWMSAPLPADHPGRQTQAKSLLCIASASSCAEAHACLWYESLVAGDPRCNGVTPISTGTCSSDGAYALFCPDYIERCASPYFGASATCAKDPDGYAFCALPTGCTKSSCQGTLLVNLCEGQGKPAAIQDCAAQGYSCGPDPVGQPACLSGGAAKRCETAAVACSGDIVSICDGLQIAEIDCALAGGTCDAVKTAPRCVYPWDTCSPGDQGVDTCQGSTISLCVSGKRQSFDCASVGLSCKPRPSGGKGYCG